MLGHISAMVPWARQREEPYEYNSHFMNRLTEWLKHIHINDYMFLHIHISEYIIRQKHLY